MSGHTIKIEIKKLNYATCDCDVDVRNYDVQAYFHYNYQLNYDKLLKSN